MPELPEVETIRRDLAPLLVGQRIEGVRIHAGAERLAVTDTPRDLERALTGRTVEAIGRHGKYLLLRLDDGRTWVMHLRMTGSLVHALADAPPHRFERARIDLDDGTTLRFNELRKCGTWHLVEDPRVAVKAVLLDQAVAAGVGNIYADEACWIAAIDPRTPASRIGPTRATRLHAAVLQTLSDSLDDRGSSFSDYRDGLGGEGLHHVRVHVFRREGQACGRCGAIILKTRVAGRGTHYCPGCQRR